MMVIVQQFMHACCFQQTPHLVPAGGVIIADPEKFPVGEVVGRSKCKTLAKVERWAKLGRK